MEGKPRLSSESTVPRIDLKEISLRESEQVEWKDQVADVDDVVRSICAFANDWSNLGGGYVVCGAREETDEAGFQRVLMHGLSAARFREIEGRVLEKCRSRVFPQIAPMVEEIPVGESAQRVLVFVVPASRQAHQLRAGDDGGSYFVRIGRSTIEARNGILRELLVRKGAALPWDHRPCAAASAEDLDLLTLREILTRAALWDPGRDLEDYFDENKPLHALMPSIGLREPLTDIARPRNFALLLFGRDTTRFIEAAYAIVSIYPGVDRGEPYSERQEMIGPLVTQIARVIELVNAQSGTTFDKAGAQAPNITKFPARALQEAIVNAFVHRDFELRHPTRITIFSDRIEITSPGGLLAGVDRQAFLAGKGRPLWRNQALSLLLNRLNLAQGEGQGVPTIFRSMRDAGNPAPIFELSEQSVTCILPAHPRHSLMMRLKAVEEAIVLGRLTEARRDLDILLANDPYNVRTVELFLNVCRLQRDAAAIESFVREHRDALDHFPRASLVLLSEGLLEVKELTRGQRELVEELLSRATQSVMELQDARRAAMALRKAGDVEAVVRFVDRQLHLHPSWVDPPMLQIRARALMDLAKMSMKTAGKRSITARLRRSAWEQTHRYLEGAEKDLREALQHADGGLHEWLQKDLGFLKELRRRAGREYSRSQPRN